MYCFFFCKIGLIQVHFFFFFLPDFFPDFALELFALFDRFDLADDFALRAREEDEARDFPFFGSASSLGRGTYSTLLPWHFFWLHIRQCVGSFIRPIKSPCKHSRQYRVPHHLHMYVVFVVVQPHLHIF